MRLCSWLCALLWLGTVGCGETSLTPGRGGGGGGGGIGGGGGGGSSDGGVAADMAQAGPYQTPYPPQLPQARKGAGKVLPSPRLVPVFWARDALQASTEAFLQAYVTRSSAWQVLQQYGVGRGTVSASVVLTSALADSVTDDDLRALLSARVKDGTVPAPGADGNTLYLLYTSANVLVLKDAYSSCQDFGAYHDATKLADGTLVPYAVMPRCSASSMALLSAASSHEVAEVATDPFLDGYNQLAAPHGLWSFALYGAEVADLCENLADPVATESGVGVVSRLWSNAAARERKHPCQPAPAAAPFFAVPIANELRAVVLDGVREDVESVTVAAGQSVTMDVRVYAPGSAGQGFTVRAQEFPLPPAVEGLSFAWSEAPGQARVTAQDGATVHLQITAKPSAAAGYTTVRLTTASGAAESQWVGAVRVTR